MKIAVKEVGKELQIIETNEKYRSKCARKYTGEEQYIDCVILGKDFALVVNEDGLPLDLPMNFLIETTSPHYPIQKIVGNAVFIRTKPVNPLKEIYDYEVTDLTQEDIDHIIKMLDSDYQEKLSAAFIDYGYGEAFLEFFMR